MKTYKNLISIALSDEIMDEASKSACENKLDRPTVQKVIKNKEFLKQKLREKILACALLPLRHSAHIINDGIKRKIRTIIQPFFTPSKPEQWIQHIVVKTLTPIFTRGMYEFSCGSVPGRGVHYGKKHLEKFIRNHSKQCKYVLKLDIRHFYENLNPEFLKRRFAKIIKDEKMLALISFVLDSNVGILPDGRVVGGGVPIGFYTSQWFANWFLQPFDHFVKEELRAAFYMRYMDDIVIFGNNKRKLHRDFIQIQKYLATLGLEVKSNWQVFRFDFIGKDGKRRGRFIDFMGFKFYHDRTTIRRSIYLNACRLALTLSKKLKISQREASSLLSYLGWFKPTKTFRAYQKYIVTRVSPKFLKTIVSKHAKRENRRKNGSTIQNGSKQPKAVRNRR